MNSSSKNPRRVVLVLIAFAMIISLAVLPSESATADDNSGQVLAYIQAGGSVPMSSFSVVVSLQVDSSTDDAEERISNGSVNLTSSDLELGADGSNPQIAGMRFNNLQVPRGAVIESASIEFEVDETSSGSTLVTIKGENTDNAAVFTGNNNDISSRPVTSARVDWDIPAWNTVSSKQQSPDIASIISEIINRPGWSAGNSIVITVSGSGRRTAESYNGKSANAPKLTVTYSTQAGITPTPSSTQSPTPISTSSIVIALQVDSPADDAEERISNGSVNLTSSDLELVTDGSRIQMVGMKFNNVAVPQGATITSAYIEFQVDENQSETTSLSFFGQAADNVATFTTSTRNISSRPKTTASVGWNNIPAWSVIGAKQQSPDLSPIIQEIVNRLGWSQGNSMAIIVTGSGHRTAEAYNGSTTGAPKLVVTYSTAPVPTPTDTPSLTLRLPRHLQ